MQRQVEGLAGLLFAFALLLGVNASAFANSYEDSLSAAHRGDTAQLVDLLGRGLDADTVDAHGNTLLIIAAREGHEDTVAAVLKYRPQVSRRNESGDSALMLATLKGATGIVDRLLDAGAQVDHDGWTPLLYAAFEGHLDIVERLLRHGAEVNALAPNGANALMVAARNGHIDVVRRLLQTDINLYQETDRGLTAVTWALDNGNTDIADLIRAAQAQRPRPSGDGALRIDIQ